MPNNTGPMDEQVERLVARAIGATPAKGGGPIGKYLWDVDLANAARAAIEAMTASVIDKGLLEMRQREVQLIGAAISVRSWQGVEKAYNELRDKMDAALANQIENYRKTLEVIDEVANAEARQLIRGHTLNCDYWHDHYEHECSCKGGKA